MLDISEQKKMVKRQLQLVNENIELTKDLEFKDYRISKLESEILELKKLLLKQSELKNQAKFTYERYTQYI